MAGRTNYESLTTSPEKNRRKRYLIRRQPTCEIPERLAALNEQRKEEITEEANRGATYLVIAHAGIGTDQSVVYFGLVAHQLLGAAAQQHPVAPRRAPRLHVARRLGQFLLERVGRGECHRIFSQSVLERLQLLVEGFQLKIHIRCVL